MPEQIRYRVSRALASPGCTMLDGLLCRAPLRRGAPDVPVRGTIARLEPWQICRP